MEIFNIISPTPILSAYIKHYWILEINDILTTSERIMPTGCINLIFHKGNTIQSSLKNDLQPQSFVCGQISGYDDLITMGYTKMIVIVFQPFGSRPFFNMPMNKFFNNQISIDDIGDPLLKELELIIQNTPDDSSCITLLEKFFIKRLYNCENYNYKRMVAAINAINNLNYTDITTLSSITCLSKKQFTRIFTEYIGARPKEYSRIIRFQKALFILQNNPDINLTQLSVEAGYYDQPHLIKEFKILSGYTPNEYRNICIPYSDYFSLV